ncbi:MAG: hypothetical protein GY807_07935 [Gammaproteobacteria bacterium]|nr:hypothetical protein [Gammaproteobacteria bacterium]
MEFNRNEEHQLVESIRLLTQAVESGERRMRRMDAWITRFTLVLLTVFGLVGYVAFNLLSTSVAVAEPEGVLQRLEHGVAEFTDEEVAKIRAWEEREKRKFHHMMEQMRANMNKVGKIDPLHSVAIILKDMKEMLEAVPRMADRMDTMNVAILQMNEKMSAMPAMAVDMHHMNGKMGIMSHGVDSTMGRMGRMMPWMP